jgi:hypothetical protein
MVSGGDRLGEPSDDRRMRRCSKTYDMCGTLASGMQRCVRGLSVQVTGNPRLVGRMALPRL